MNTELIYIGLNGSQINLFSNEYFHLVDVDGLTGVSSALSTNTTPSIDGDKINNIRAYPRGIDMYFRIRNTVAVEDAKRFVLRTIKPKQRGKMRLTQGDRVMEISGIVENIEMPRFSDEVTMHISFYCPEPFWQDAENVLVEISRILNMHYFTAAADNEMLYFPVEGIALGEYDLNMTRTYTNDGDADCGMIIHIIALGDVLNPVIYKADGTFIGVNESMVVGDEIIINTKRGEKSITKNGVNILSKIKGGSSFLQLETGDNELTIDSDGGTEGNVYFMLEFKRRFV